MTKPLDEPSLSTPIPMPPGPVHILGFWDRTALHPAKLRRGRGVFLFLRSRRKKSRRRNQHQQSRHSHSRHMDIPSAIPGGVFSPAGFAAQEHTP
jgi:hypothetical protein